MIMMWHHLVVRPIDRIVRDALCIFLLWGMAQGKAFGADLPQPGFGYPGRLEPYASMPEMQEGLVKFGMTAGRFRRDALPTGYVGRVKLQANELPYLLFSPRRGAKAVPMVVYFGGTGEQGTDLSLHFRQTVLFSRLTEAEFQKRHPCYIFAPMLPKGAVIRAALPGERSLMADLVCDALYAVIAAQRTPGVDTNRLYVTGLSWGGVAAFELACGFPGRFAACVPTACIQSPLRIPRKRPGNYWMLYNENSYKSEWSQSAIREIEQIVRSGGGDFRCSTFPDRGHDAWRKAWCEDAVWEWAFSKGLEGRSRHEIRVHDEREMAFRQIATAKCRASIAGKDANHGPERCLDGLDATAYISRIDARRGDWVEFVFELPIRGRFKIYSGLRDGTARLRRAAVEVSADGRRWSRVGSFSERDGVARVEIRTSVKWLRIVCTGSDPQPLVLRKIVSEKQ